MNRTIWPCLLLCILAGASACWSPAPTELRYTEEVLSSPSRWEQTTQLQRPISPDNFDPAAFRAACFYATNDARRRHGRDATERSAALEGAAQLHAERMIAKGFIAHEDPTSGRYRTPKDRAASVGIANPQVTENIAMTTTIQYTSGRPVYPRGGPAQFSYSPSGPILPKHTYVSMAREVVQGWLDSPGHRRNLLDQRAVQLGCGAAFSWRDKFPSIHAVQNFQVLDSVIVE